MSWRPRSVGLLALTLWVFAAPSGTQELPDTQDFGVVVDSVVVWAAVNDRRGRPRTDLEMQDFEIYEDGVRQRLTGFELGSETPLSAQILMDASKSMEISGLMVAAKRAAFYLLARLGDADQASLWYFAGRRTYRDCKMGTPLLRIGESIQALQGFGETTLRDSVLESLLSEEGTPQSRRAVFLFTDGRDNASLASEEEIAAIAGSHNIPVHAVILSPRPARDTDPSELEALERAVVLSGGQFVIVHPMDGEAPIDAINTAVDRLRSSYVLEYSPEGTGGTSRRGFHRIEVKVRCRRCTALHRKGYYAR